MVSSTGVVVGGEKIYAGCGYVVGGLYICGVSPWETDYAR